MNQEVRMADKKEEIDPELLKWLSSPTTLRFLKSLPDALDKMKDQIQSLSDQFERRR